MYYPFLRGKQNELIVIRDNAHIIAQSKFVPIVEPVKKESLGSLAKSVDAVKVADGEVVIVVNPEYGYFSRNSKELITWFRSNFLEEGPIRPGIFLTADMSVEDAEEAINQMHGHDIVLLHKGFRDPLLLADLIAGKRVKENVFFEASGGKLYQRHFRGSNRILIRDGFERRKNREYPPVEFFSDLHETYLEEGMNGFGDYLIVGDEFSETGGPAYAIAIHLTFIDAGGDSAMHIAHFVSDRQDDPRDPAGKFHEALAKLVRGVRSGELNIIQSAAVLEFMGFYERRHYPGLGYVKKLSMQHHIETLSDYFSKH